jgi:hypothetical protein
MRFMLVATVCITFAGCATPYMEAKSEAAEAEFDRDAPAAVSLSAEQPAAQTLDVTRLELLVPAFSTKEDAIALCGEPKSESVLMDRTTLLQWVGDGAIAAIHFDPTGKMIRVLPRTSVAGHRACAGDICWWQ